jgi:hypothetical protein
MMESILVVNNYDYDVMLLVWVMMSDLTYFNHLHLLL